MTDTTSDASAAGTGAAIHITSAGGYTNSSVAEVDGTASGLDIPQVNTYDGDVQNGFAGVYVDGGFGGSPGAYDGNWQSIVTLTPGDNVISAGPRTGTTPTSDDTVDEVYVPTGPSITVTQAGGSTTSAAQTLSGTASTAGFGARFVAGTTLTLSEDGTTLGQTAVRTDGTWSASVTLPTVGDNLVTVADTDVAGNTGEASVSFDLQSSAPASGSMGIGRPVNNAPSPSAASIRITTASGVTDAVTTTLSGTASGLNFPQVSIYDNGSYVGSAGVYDGQWAITVAPGQGANAYTATGGTSLDPGLTSNAATLTDIRNTPPTVTIARTGKTTTSATRTLSGTVSTAGFGSRFVAGTALTLSEDGTTLGQTTVRSDGTWSAKVTLPDSGRNVITATDTDVAGGVGEASASLDLAPSAPPVVAPPPPAPPSVSISSAGGVTNGALQVITGTGTAASLGVNDVTVTEDGSAVGSIPVAADGTWSLVADLGADGAHTIQATIQDSYGDTGTSSTVGYRLDTAPPSVGFGAAPSLSGTVATLTGTAADDTGVAGVEIYDGASDLGAAQVGADGSWTFTHDFGQGSYDALTAVATDAAGNSAAASAPFGLDTGASGVRSAGAVTARDASGAVTTVTTMAADGSVGAQTVSNGDGTATATGYENGQALFSIGDDVMTGNGYREDFVFEPTMGHARITDFVATGAGHDTLTLSHADFASIAQVLNQTTMSHGAALIHASPDDTIRLAGVTKAQLAQHRADFAFTG